MLDELVTVSTFQVLPEAEAARMRLGAEGIRSFLSDAEIVNMDWLLGNAIGFIKLQVPSAQAEEAYAILEQMREEKELHASEPPVGPEETACLNCGAKLPALAKTCSICGWSYADEEGNGERSEEEADEEEPIAEALPAESTMESLRAMRRPMIWLFLLWPLVLSAALAFIIWLFTVG
jgi:hypothetical protein